MASDNKLELVVEVDVGKANASIKSINSGLSSIEQAAAKTARGASAGIDGITVSMVKGATAGNLLADSIKQAVAFAKDWTVGAAQYAAHTSKMEAVTRALANAHGEGSAAAQKAVEAVKEIGYTTQDAQGAVQKLIIADMNLAKATGLAKIAKDAAAVSTEGLSAGEAFEKIMLAIESGAGRGLRQMSIFVELNKEVEYEQARLGRTLTESEEKQVRYNAIVREAAKIQGAHAGAAAEAETQMGALKRSIDELRESVGQQFQQQFKSTIGIFKDLVGFLRDNADYLTKLGQAALWVAGILSTYALAKKIMDLAKSVAALRLASMNPYAVLAAGVVAAGAIVYNEFKGMGEQREQWFANQQKNSIRDAVGSGKNLAQLRAMGYSDDEIREAMTGKKTVEVGDFGDFGKVDIKGGGGKPTADQLKLAAEIRKKQTEAERATREAAAQANARSAVGFAKDIGEVNAQIQKWTSFVDEKGLEHHFELTKQAWANIIADLRGRFAGYLHDVTAKNKDAAAEYLKDLKEANDRAIEYEAHRYQQRLQFDDEWAAKAMEHVQQVYAFEEQRAGFDRDARLREVEAADAQTLAQKLRAEQQKADIEIEYLERTHEIKMRTFDAETSTQVLQFELQMRALGFQADVIDQRIADFTQRRDELRQQQQDTTDAATQAARENAGIRQAQMVRDQYRQIFDSLKEQAGGVFDALLSKSKSVWSAMGDAFKTAILTAIKEIVTSRIAAMLMQLFTGTSVSFAQGGVGGGSLGRVGGMLGLGAVPMFGGSGGGGLSLSQLLGPGGTSGFAGPVQQMAPGLIGVGQTSSGQLVLAPMQSGMGAASLGSKFGAALPAGLSMAGLMMLASGVRGGRGVMGTVNRIGGSAMFGAGAGMMLGPMMGASAGFGAGVGLPIGIGAGLMMDAWVRGGKAGMAEAVGGGALAGATIGSMVAPGIGTAIGAAIGAGVGLIEGFIGLFRKSAAQKLTDKIRSLYHIEVRDKGVLAQIVEMAKQYGGNLEMTIRAPQVAELLELYALSTGQQFPMRNVPRPFVMSQSGGSLYQMPSYDRGQAYGYSGLPMFGGMNFQPVQSGQSINLQLDPQATREFLEGRMVSTISDNPEVVVAATSQGASRNVSRRDLAASVLAPGTVLS